LLTFLPIWAHFGPGLAGDHDFLPPSVFAVFLAKNKADILPEALALFGSQDYPKERISLFVRFDRDSADQTEQIWRAWLDQHADEYFKVDFASDDHVLSQYEVR